MPRRVRKKDGLPAYVFGSKTSKAAAEKIRMSTATMRNRIFALIKLAGKVGATCDEVEEMLGFKHQTASARINELTEDKRICRSGLTRKTRSFCNADVMIAGDKPLVVPQASFDFDKSDK